MKGKKGTNCKLIVWKSDLEEAKTVLLVLRQSDEITEFAVKPTTVSRGWGITREEKLNITFCLKTTTYAPKLRRALSKALPGGYTIKIT